jgi:hypothetical protein
MLIKRATINDITSLKSIINSPILITGNNALQNEETAENMWWLSVDPDAAKAISINDLVEFVNSLIQKKTQQIMEAGVIHSVLFYMWFDEMAAQLRFNIISDLGKKFPFDCRVEILDSPELILEDFLASHYHAGIPWDELEELNDDSDEDEGEPFILRVFVKQLQEK